MRKIIGNDFKIGVISSLTASVIWVILGSLWSLIVANVVSLFYNPVILPWQYFVVGISLGAAFVSSIMFYRSNLNKFKPKFPSLTMDYIYKKTEKQLYFNTREEMVYTSLYTVQALKEIDWVERTVFWSGSTISEPYIVSDNNHKVEPYKNDGFKKVSRVMFEVPLGKNEETTFSLKYELGDSLKKMNPLLGHYVSNPTEKTTLTLCVPHGMVNSVKKCIFADSLAEVSLTRPLIIEPRLIGNNDVYEWVIDNPSLLYYYRIIWEFS